MTRVWIATLLNLLLPGGGYLFVGHERAAALAWIAGFTGLTLVARSSLCGPELALMAGSMLVVNAAFAADAYGVAKARLTRAAT